MDPINNSVLVHNFYFGDQTDTVRRVNYRKESAIVNFTRRSSFVRFSNSLFLNVCNFQIPGFDEIGQSQLLSNIE